MTMTAIVKIQKTDLELIKEILSGDTNAFGMIAEKYRSKIYAFILLKTQDEMLAEDIVQDTFLKGLKFIEKGEFKETGNLQGWLICIAKNLFIDHYRKSKRSPIVEMILLNEDGDIFTDLLTSISCIEKNIEQKIIFNEQISEVRKCINLLSKEQRRIIILRHYYNFKFKEIALIDEISINTAVGRMRYALNNMRRLMFSN